jgi:hypothetical protein
VLHFHRRPLILGRLGQRVGEQLFIDDGLLPSG